MLARLDSFLLERAQKFCDKLQQLTGITKFKVSKWLIVMDILGLCSALILDFKIIDIPVIVLNTVFMILWIMNIEKEETYFQECGRILGSSLTWFFQIAFIRKTGAVSYFSIFLMMVLPEPDGGILQVKYYYLAIGSMCMFLFVYVTACIPKPPSKSTARKWYEKSITWLNDKLVGGEGVVPEASNG